MNNLEQRRDRFMKDSIQIRLGGLAANLARIGSFIKNSSNLAAVKSLIEESKFFIEWTARELNAENASEIVKLQIELAILDRNCEKNWENEEKRLEISKQAGIWSKQVLQNAGLIQEIEYESLKFASVKKAQKFGAGLK